MVFTENEDQIESILLAGKCCCSLLSSSSLSIVRRRAELRKAKWVVEQHWDICFHLLVFLCLSFLNIQSITSSYPFTSCLLRQQFPLRNKVSTETALV